jgi:ribose transport system ATP-binding protein
MPEVTFEAQQIVKRYGGVTALSDGNLKIYSGEVVALVGANGSGKSTLAKVITGVVDYNQGKLTREGRPVHYPNPITARKAGITAVFQELSLVPQMTVAENIWLAHEPLQSGGWVAEETLQERTAELLALFSGTYQSTLHPDALIEELSPDEKQIVEILKAYSLKPEVLILDEATASLDSQQVKRLFELVERWKHEGMALVFVSHRMDEIFQIADRAAVLRNGKSVGEVLISEVTENDIVEMMVGQERGLVEERAAPAELEDREIMLRVENLSSDSLHGVSFDVRHGELLGIGGLRGQGQHSLLRAIFGAIPFEGKLILDGKPVHFDHPDQAMAQEIALVPGDRATEGLLMIRSILENLHLANWKSYGLPLRMQQARKKARQMAGSLNLVMESIDAQVRSLSGGNAQKVVIGKWLLRQPKLLLLDDPTKGVDVGTKTEFYALLDELQTEGTTILFYSSDDTELLSLCDRILVLHDGKIEEELSGSTLTKTHLVSASMGGTLNNESSHGGDH